MQAERRRKLGLPPEDPVTVKPAQPVVEEKKVVILSDPIQILIFCNSVMKYLFFSFVFSLMNLSFYCTAEFIAHQACYQSRANEGMLTITQAEQQSKHSLIHCSGYTFSC